MGNQFLILKKMMLIMVNNMSRPARGFRTASKNCYNSFCRKNPEIHITFEEYKKILYTYNELLVTYLLETGEKYKIPYGLGEVVVNKYKPKQYVIDPTGVEHINLPIDWKESKKHGKKVYILNSHTDGYKYYWMWNYWKTKIKFSSIWRFSMARVHRRMLNVYLRKPNSKYKDLYRQYPRVK